MAGKELDKDSTPSSSAAWRDSCKIAIIPEVLDYLVAIKIKARVLLILKNMLTKCVHNAILYGVSVVTLIQDSHWAIYRDSYQVIKTLTRYYY